MKYPFATLARWRGIEARINRLATWHNALNGTAAAYSVYRAPPMIPARPFDRVHPRLRAAQARLDGMCYPHLYFSAFIANESFDYWKFADPTDMLYPLFLERRNTQSGLIETALTGDSEQEPFCVFEQRGSERSWRRLADKSEPLTQGRILHDGSIVGLLSNWRGDRHGEWIWEDIEKALGLEWVPADDEHVDAAAPSPYTCMIRLPGDYGIEAVVPDMNITATITGEVRTGTGSSGNVDGDGNPWASEAAAGSAADADFSYGSWAEGAGAPIITRQVLWNGSGYVATVTKTEVKVKFNFTLPTGESEPTLSFVMAIYGPISAVNVFDAPSYTEFDPAADPVDTSPIIVLSMTRNTFLTLPMPEPSWPSGVGTGIETRGWVAYNGGYDFKTYDGDTVSKAWELPHIRVELQ